MKVRINIPYILDNEVLNLCNICQTRTYEYQTLRLMLVKDGRIKIQKGKIAVDREVFLDILKKRAETVITKNYPHSDVLLSRELYQHITGNTIENKDAGHVHIWATPKIETGIIAPLEPKAKADTDDEKALKTIKDKSIPEKLAFIERMTIEGKQFCDVIDTEMIKEHFNGSLSFYQMFLDRAIRQTLMTTIYHAEKNSFSYSRISGKASLKAFANNFASFLSVATRRNSVTYKTLTLLHAYIAAFLNLPDTEARATSLNHNRDKYKQETNKELDDWINDFTAKDILDFDLLNQETLSVCSNINSVTQGKTHYSLSVLLDNGIKLGAIIFPAGLENNYDKCLKLIKQIGVFHIYEHKAVSITSYPDTKPKKHENSIVISTTNNKLSIQVVYNTLLGLESGKLYQQRTNN